MAQPEDTMEVAALATTLMAAVVTRPDANVFSANWVEDWGAATIARSVSLARSIMQEVEATAPAIPVAPKKPRRR